MRQAEAQRGRRLSQVALGIMISHKVMETRRRCKSATPAALVPEDPTAFSITCFSSAPLDITISTAQESSVSVAPPSTTLTSVTLFSVSASWKGIALYSSSGSVSASPTPYDSSSLSLAPASIGIMSPALGGLFPYFACDRFSASSFLPRLIGFWYRLLPVGLSRFPDLPPLLSMFRIVICLPGLLLHLFCYLESPHLPLVMSLSPTICPWPPLRTLGAVHQIQTRVCPPHHRAAAVNICACLFPDVLQLPTPRLQPYSRLQSPPLPPLLVLLMLPSFPKTPSPQRLCVTLIYSPSCFSDAVPTALSISQLTSSRARDSR